VLDEHLDLVELVIDSISLNPDTVVKTTQRILEMESRLQRSPGMAEAERPQAADVAAASPPD
jgi:hypothetical protein